MKVCPTYIGRGDATLLRKCIFPVAGVAMVSDEPESDEMATVFAERGYLVFRREWVDDFSVWRNESLRLLAARGYEWMFRIDCDELFPLSWYMEAERRLEGLLDVDVVCVRCVRPCSRNEVWFSTLFNYTHRFIRVTPEIEFRGKVHEWVYCGDERLDARSLRCMMFDDLMVADVQYLEGRAVRVHKIRFYHKLLTGEDVTYIPDDPPHGVRFVFAPEMDRLLERVV